MSIETSYKVYVKIKYFLLIYFKTKYDKILVSRVWGVLISSYFNVMQSTAANSISSQHFPPFYLQYIPIISFTHTLPALIRTTYRNLRTVLALLWHTYYLSSVHSLHTPLQYIKSEYLSLQANPFNLLFCIFLISCATGVEGKAPANRMSKHIGAQLK